MKLKPISLAVMSFALLVGCVQAEDGAKDASHETISGTLQVGKTKSVVLYLGAESGDYAAYCFTNKSEAGVKILAACKDGDKCEITGMIDYDSGCEVPGLEATLSAAGRIVSIKSVATAAGKAPAAKPEAAVAATPDSLVRDLYAAHKRDKGPFFQSDDRAAVDRYFSKDFADLIWRDSDKAGDGVGAIDFDPLYHAQDTEISAFKLGKPEAGSGVTTLEVSFKNFGKTETIRFLMERNKEKAWKITDIRYQNGDLLKGLLHAALKP